jgi:leucyl/phenylalanyl-tRNA---protein transferase
VTIPWLNRDDPFPAVDSALVDPNGLLAAGADLSPERLVDAYAHGIFPWFNDGDPILWWSPDPRMVLFVNELHVSRSLRRVMASGAFSVTADQAFAEVVAGCAAPRRDEDGTWITDDMSRAYERLAAIGLAHSIEVWQDAELVGGLYGVALGRMFYGESMFSRVSNGSKVALVCLVRQLRRWGFELIDCQMSTPHLASLGAREIARAEFIPGVTRLASLTGVPAPWRLDKDLQ